MSNSKLIKVVGIVASIAGIATFLFHDLPDFINKNDKNLMTVIFIIGWILKILFSLFIGWVAMKVYYFDSQFKLIIDGYVSEINSLKKKISKIENDKEFAINESKIAFDNEIEKVLELIDSKKEFLSDEITKVENRNDEIITKLRLGDMQILKTQYEVDFIKLIFKRIYSRQVSSQIRTPSGDVSQFVAKAMNEDYSSLKSEILEVFKELPSGIVDEVFSNFMNNRLSAMNINSKIANEHS